MLCQAVCASSSPAEGQLACQGAASCLCAQDAVMREAGQAVLCLQLVDWQLLCCSPSS